MEHQTIRRTADGQLIDVECPCGEDHGPSVREELTILREANRRHARELNELAEDMERVLKLTDTERVDGVDRREARRLVRKASAKLDVIARDLHLGSV